MEKLFRSFKCCWLTWAHHLVNFRQSFFFVRYLINLKSVTHVRTNVHVVNLQNFKFFQAKLFNLSEHFLSDFLTSTIQLFTRSCINHCFCKVAAYKFFTLLSDPRSTTFCDFFELTACKFLTGISQLFTTIRINKIM